MHEVDSLMEQQAPGVKTDGSEEISQTNQPTRTCTALLQPSQKLSPLTAHSKIGMTSQPEDKLLLCIVRVHDINISFGI